jgi:hypothetical protein
MADNVIGYYGVINHDDPDSNLVMGSIIEDDDTIQAATKVLTLLKQESRDIAARRRAQQPETDGSYRNPFGEHDTHHVRTIAIYRLGLLAQEQTTDDMALEVRQAMALIVSRMEEVRGFVIELWKDRYNLLRIEGDEPDLLKAEVEATLKRSAE